MKIFFISLSLFLGALSLNAQSVMVANFDDVWPADIGTWSIGDIDYVPAEAPATGDMATFTVPAGNPSDGGIYIVAEETFDPRDYVGVSFLCKGNVDAASFILKLEQSSDGAGIYRIQDWNSWPKYTGNGEWQEVHVTFDICFKELEEALIKDANFPATSYDKIVFCPAPYEGKPEFTLYIDDVKLRTSWEDEGNAIPVVNAKQNAISVENGVVKAYEPNAFLKVYSISGQEIASGTQQVLLNTKGVYIVKTSTTNTTSVAKVIVK